jgi:hypothetical protein
LLDRIGELEKSFREQKINMLVLIERLEVQLGNLSEHTGNRIQDLEFSREVDELKKKLGSATGKVLIAQVAAKWLYERQPLLVQYASEIVFDSDRRLREDLRITVSPEGCMAFQKDVYNLLSWIVNYLAAGGLIPRNLRRDFLASPIEYKFYAKAFEGIRDNKICVADQKEIDVDALRMLVSYFNRFLIQRQRQEI